MIGFALETVIVSIAVLGMINLDENCLLIVIIYVREFVW
jgi:hypothetical protein